MTVDELLTRIIGLPGVTPEAMKTYAPVFRSRFEKREGEHLRVAFEETLATFKPTAKQPFPIPADIEAHMPSLRTPEQNGGKPIRPMLEKRALRAKILIDDWMAGQGAKIRQSRPEPLYAACLLEAMDQAKAKALDERISGIVLDQAKVNECFQRAISAERVRRHGRIPHDAQRWWSQIVPIAAEWGLTITPGWWSKKTAEALDRKDAA